MNSDTSISLEIFLGFSKNYEYDISKNLIRERNKGVRMRTSLFFSWEKEGNCYEKENCIIVNNSHGTWYVWRLWF